MKPEYFFRLADAVRGLGTDPATDELVLVIEGRCRFRVGEETRRVEAGDLMFIPRHGAWADHR